jgi:VWFA-related protein
MDSVLLLTFNDQVTTIEDPTNNPQNLSKILRRVKTGGNTALYDAIIEASERLRRMPETQLTRRAIVLISDGVDTAKRSTLSQAMQACARAEVMIFTLSTNNSTEAANEAGDVILKNLAEATGGSLLPAHEERQLSSAFRTVERALRNQYVMAYNPASFQADGSFRTIQVIPRKRGLRAACRKGYYASWRVFR